MTNIILASITFSFAFAICVTVNYFLFIFLAVPHSGLLPEWIGGIVVILLLAFTIFIQTYLAK